MFVAIKSTTSLEVTMGLTFTSFRRVEKYNFKGMVLSHFLSKKRIYMISKLLKILKINWFREILNVQSSILL